MKKTGTGMIMLILIIAMSTRISADPIETEIRELVAMSDAELPLNELVQITGNVLLHVDDGRETTNVYVLRGDHGNTIYVRTTDELPNVNERMANLCGYLHSGEIYRHPETGSSDSGLFLVQAPCAGGQMSGNMVMVELNSSPENADVYVNGDYIGRTPIQHPMRQGEPHRVEMERNWYRSVTYSSFVPSVNRSVVDESLSYSLVLYLLIFGAIVLVSGFVYYTLKRKEPVPHPIPEPLRPGPEDPTVPIDPPGDKTVTWLKGYFEVLDGSLNMSNIKFSVPVDKKNEKARFTLGRSDGDPKTHIKLDNPTVSRRQAELFYDRGSYQLMNRAAEQSNPTVINDRAMIINEAKELENGDIIQFADVKVKFVK